MARCQKLEYTSNTSLSLQVNVSYQPTLMHIYDLHFGQSGCEDIVTDFLEHLYGDEGVHASHKVLPTCAVWSTFMNVSTC
jgi:hypothetical protein